MRCREKHSDFKSNRRLAVAGIKKLCIGMIILGACMFLLAGSFFYWNVWLYTVSLFISIFAMGVYLYRNDQELLKKRLNSKEKEKAQKGYGLITGFALLGSFIVCGLDYRFGWSKVPIIVVLVALTTMMSGFLLFAVTLVQNSFASRTIEIQDKQVVIDTGVYSKVRHPLYSAAIAMFFMSPFVLGSFYAVIPSIFYIAAIILRIRNEEEVLCKGLDGYENYLHRVKYRLIPYVW